MSNVAAQSPPKLDKPGAGLPPIEWFVAKYFLLPKLLKVDQKTAIENFDKECQKIQKICAGLTDEQLTEKRLIKRLRGLEDSSRYWSIVMTLEHLVVVDELMLQAATALSSGVDVSAFKPTGTADVKPEGKVSAQKILANFEAMRIKLVEEASTLNVELDPKATLPHPWFGPLNALEWLNFTSIHTNLHRRQILAIIEQLQAK
ncbi:MAG: DinB family protein [Cyanobacteria bacterium REEB67]|nr:DinB family protein [Cyanobacteria bacterium REEB67]